MDPFLQSRRFLFPGLRFRLIPVLIGCLLWAGFPGEAPAQSRLQIFKLQHRQAAELIPVIQPLLQGKGTVTGMGNQLIVRTSPDNLQMVRRVLGELDAPLRNLRITVRQGLQSEKQRTEAEVAADIPVAQGRGRVIIPPATVGGGGVTGTIGNEDGVIQGRVDRRSATRQEGQTQQVTTLEGKPATIYIGQRVPFQSTVIQGVGPFATRSQTIQFQDVTTGFSVLPRLNGDTVVLEIHPQQSKLQRGGRIAIQEVHTTASGKLGEWIEIGGLLQTLQAQNARLLGLEQNQAREQRRIFLKVDLVE